jgi:hypothetical protein
MMNEMHFDSMGYGEKLFWVASNPQAMTFAYARLKMHHAAAKLQMSRIWEAVGQAQTQDPAPVTSPEFLECERVKRDRIYSEIHFYFIALTGCANMLKLLTQDEEFLPARKVLSQSQQWLEHYQSGRNTFEHFGDRLQGQKAAHRVKEHSAPGAGPRRTLLGFENGEYLHSNERWDVTESSLERLDNIVTDVTAEIHAIVDTLATQQ